MARDDRSLATCEGAKFTHTWSSQRLSSCLSAEIRNSRKSNAMYVPWLSKICLGNTPKYCGIHLLIATAGEVNAMTSRCCQTPTAIIPVHWSWWLGLHSHDNLFQVHYVSLAVDFHSICEHSHDVKATSQTIVEYSTSLAFIFTLYANIFFPPLIK